MNTHKDIYIFIISKRNFGGKSSSTSLFLVKLTLTPFSESNFSTILTHPEQHPTLLATNTYRTRIRPSMSWVDNYREFVFYIWQFRVFINFFIHIICVFTCCLVPFIFPTDPSPIFLNGTLG